MNQKLEQLLDRLPDREAARRLVARLEAEHPTRFASLQRKPGVLANLMTLAAYSPWLGDALLAQPDTIDWLSRRQHIERGYTKEDYLEELGRFAARRLDADVQFMLAEFKQRELMRIYLRDCLRIATLTETTEELSHLADAILDRALTHARQELVNRYGVPQTSDERGRLVEAEFAIVALGKLGSRELNYASDIDLMFLYSGQGRTAIQTQAGVGQTIENQTFFARLSEAIFKLTGRSGKAAPVYRVDLRLRPYGRDGELVQPLDRAVEYYRTTARNWERQMLIRARASAGSEALVARFLSALGDEIYRPEPIPEAIASVKSAKDSIDKREKLRGGGFNVKLGPGGIREIEFVAQALQLAFGGQDAWIRAPRVLIGLQRLADKGFLSDSDRAALSEAYAFLRTVEHRVQMAQGVQTHRVPVDASDLGVLARRCGYEPSAGDPAECLMRDLEAHTARVRAISERVFSLADHSPEASRQKVLAEVHVPSDERFGSYAAEAAQPLETAARELTTLGRLAGEGADERMDDIRRTLGDVASRLVHPARALREFEHYLASLRTADERADLARTLAADSAALDALVRMLGSGAFFSEMLVNRPELAAAIPEPALYGARRPLDAFRATLESAVFEHSGFSSRMAALRRAWYREIVVVGSHDVLGKVGLRQINREQTDLAQAALDIACRVVLDELSPDPDLRDGLRYSVLALGRLGHAGMDYGSDLDLLVVYDGAAPPPIAGGDSGRFYGRFAQLLVKALSSLTREGYVYRVDLRLRPDGRAGELAQSAAGLLEYLFDRASPWELTAYLKLRPTAGDLAFGRSVRDRSLQTIFDAAARCQGIEPKLRAVRLQLERDRAKVGRNIKWGPGGMMDVYFVTRYSQLKHRIAFSPEHGTLALIDHLGAAGALGANLAQTLSDGYRLLRGIDHHLRLVGDRLAPRVPEAVEPLEEVAYATGYASVAGFDAALTQTMKSIRAAFDCVFVES